MIENEFFLFILKNSHGYVLNMLHIHNVEFFPSREKCPHFFLGQGCPQKDSYRVYSPLSQARKNWKFFTFTLEFNTRIVKNLWDFKIRNQKLWKMNFLWLKNSNFSKYRPGSTLKNFWVCLCSGHLQFILLLIGYTIFA